MDISTTTAERLALAVTRSSCGVLTPGVAISPTSEYVTPLVSRGMTTLPKPAGTVNERMPACCSTLDALSRSMSSLTMNSGTAYPPSALTSAVITFS